MRERAALTTTTLHQSKLKFPRGANLQHDTSLTYTSYDTAENESNSQLNVDMAHLLNRTLPLHSSLGFAVSSGWDTMRMPVQPFAANAMVRQRWRCECDGQNARWYANAMVNETIASE